MKTRRNPVLLGTMAVIAVIGVLSYTGIIAVDAIKKKKQEEERDRFRDLMNSIMGYGALTVVALGGGYLALKRGKDPMRSSL